MSSELLRLCEYLKKISDNNRLCIAFSGGVDSSVLVCAAASCSIDVLAITFDSLLIDNSIEVISAKKAAESINNIRHEILSADVLSDKRISSNSHERCYYCKHILFSRLSEYAENEGYYVICDGTNTDDTKEYRPGLKALKECGIISPFAVLSLTKKDIRKIASEIIPAVSDKPSSPCLLTRFPYDTDVSREMLKTVYEAEKVLKSYGFESCRYRMYKDINKIELKTDDIEKFKALYDEISESLINAGTDNFVLDEKGLRSGTMDGK